jgi:hypothetical protein
MKSVYLAGKVITRLGLETQDSQIKRQTFGARLDSA